MDCSGPAGGVREIDRLPRFKNELFKNTRKIHKCIHAPGGGRRGTRDDVRLSFLTGFTFYVHCTNEERCTPLTPPHPFKPNPSRFLFFCFFTRRGGRRVNTLMDRVGSLARLLNLGSLSISLTPPAGPLQSI